MNTAEPTFYKDPAIAVVLSFLYTGLGHFYNGEFVKGAVLIVVYAISLVLMTVFIGFLTTPILWIYGMVDAYGSAKRINAELQSGASR